MIRSTRAGRENPRWVRVFHRAQTLVLLLSVGFFVIWRFVLYLEVNARFRSLEREGYPVSGTKLNHWPTQIPEAQNGALIITQACALLPEIDGESLSRAEEALLSRTNVWNFEMRQAVEGLLSSNCTVSALALQGLAFKEFRYPLDHSFSLATDYALLRQVRQISRVACLEAALLADAGKEQDCSERLTLALRLARTFDNEPAVSPFLIRAGMLRQVAKATEWCLNRSALENMDTKELQDALLEASQINTLPLAYIGGRAEAIPLFRLSLGELQALAEMNGVAAPQRFRGRPSFFLWATGFLERDLNFFLESMEQAVNDASLPPPTNQRLRKYLEERGDQASKRWMILSPCMVFGLSELPLRHETQRALCSMAATALAVERFRKETLQFPEKLEQLVPEFLHKVPVDPFDGAAIHYRVFKHGYKLYSVGRDGRDDGGREPPVRRKSSDTNQYDLTFVVERPNVKP